MNDKTEKHGCMEKQAMDRLSKGEIVLAILVAAKNVNQGRQEWDKDTFGKL